MIVMRRLYQQFHQSYMAKLIRGFKNQAISNTFPDGSFPYHINGVKLSKFKIVVQNSNLCLMSHNHRLYEAKY